MPDVTLSLADVIDGYLHGHWTEQQVAQALADAGGPCVYKGEKWFARKGAEGPSLKHLPFWVAASRINNIDVSMVPEAGTDEQLAEKHGVRLARDITVTVPAPKRK